MKKDISDMQKFIDHLFSINSRYSSPSIAMSFSSVLDAISKDIYNDPTRFFFELLQNADDASLGTSKLEMSVRAIDDEWIIFSYNGRPFTERDVLSICSSGDSNKVFDSQKTGSKGIGFKSIFKLTDYLILYSGDFSFSFNKDYWVDQTIWQPDWGSYQEFAARRKGEGYMPPYLSIPWHIIPIWTDITSASYYTIIKDYSVNIIFKPKIKPSLVSGMIADILNKAINILFLRCTNVEIKVLDNSKLIKEIHKQTGEHTVTIWDDSTNRRSFILKSLDVKLTDHLDEQSFNSMIRDNEDIPEKIKRSQVFNIAFAGEIKNDVLCVPETSLRLLYSFLPTKANYNFPYLLNANFILDASRTNIHENNFLNMLILYNSPRYLFQWIKELVAVPGNSTRVLNLIPNKVNFPEKMADDFQQNLRHEIECNEFLLSYENKFLRPGEALMDETEIIWSGRLNVLDQGLFFEFLSQVFNMKVGMNSFINPLIEEQRDKEYSISVYDIGVRKVNFELLIEYLKYLSESTLSTEKLINENINLLCLFDTLFKCLTGVTKQSLISVLSENKFIFNDKMILTDNWNLVIPHESLAYMELQKNQSPVHPQIVTALRGSKYPSLKAFLIIDLDIHEISDNEMMEFFSRNLKSETLINKFDINSCEAYGFLYQLSNTIPDFKYEQFSDCLILNSLAKYCKKQNLYISVPYTDEFSEIQEHMWNRSISSLYMSIIEKNENRNDSLVSLKKFFKKLGCKMPLEILTNNLKEFLTTENNIDIVLWIAERWNQKKYTNNQIWLLEECTLLDSKHGFDVPSKLYFQDAFSPPNLQFQKLLCSGKFLSELYFKISPLSKDTLIKFFEIIGVKYQNQMLMDSINNLYNMRSVGLTNSIFIFQALIEIYNTGKIKPSYYKDLSDIHLYNNQGDATKPVSSLYVLEQEETPKMRALASFFYPSMFLNAQYVTNKSSLNFLKAIEVKRMSDLEKDLPKLLNTASVKCFKECLVYLFSLYCENSNLFQGYYKSADFDKFNFYTSTGLVQRNLNDKIYFSNKFSKRGKGIEFVVTDVSYISYEAYFEANHHVPNFKKFLQHIGILSQKKLIPKLTSHLTNSKSSFNVFLWLLNKYLKNPLIFPKDIFTSSVYFYDRNNTYQSVLNQIYIPDDISPEFKFQNLLPCYRFLNTDYYKDICSENNIKNISSFYSQFGVLPQENFFNNFDILSKLESYDAIVLRFAELYNKKLLPEILVQKLLSEGLWLRTQKGTLTNKSKEIYFSSAYTNGESIHLEEIINEPQLFISDFYLQHDPGDIVKFFTFVGVQPQKTLLIRSPKYMKPTNSIPLMRLACKKLYWNSQEKKEFYTNIEMEKVHCLSQNGQFLPINSLYLGFAYEPEQDLEKCIFSDIFLSQSYIDESYSKDQKISLLNFFIELGVKRVSSIINIFAYLTETNAPAYFNLIYDHPRFDKKLFVEKMKSIRGLTLQGNYIKFANLYFSDKYYDSAKDYPINHCIEQDILLSDAFLSPDDNDSIIDQKKQILKLLNIKEKYEIVSLIPKLLYQYNSVDLIRFLYFIHDQSKSNSQLKLKNDNITGVLKSLNDNKIKLLTKRKSYVCSSQLYMQDVFTNTEEMSNTSMMILHPMEDNSPTLDMFIQKDIFLSPDYYSSINRNSRKHFFDFISSVKVRGELDLLCDIKQHITPENSVQLLSFIIDYSPRDIFDTFLEKMKKDTIPFLLLNQNNCMVQANQLFHCDLFSKYDLEECIQNGNLFVNEGYSKNLMRPKNMETFLTEMGVKAQKCLLNEIDDIISKHNAEAICLKIFSLFLTNPALIHPYLGKLSNSLLFQTQEGDYKLPGEMYLNDAYSPLLPIETSVKRDIFLHDSFQDNDLVKSNFHSWIKFLTELGICEYPKIELYSWENLSIKELVDGSCGSIPPSRFIREYLQKITQDLLMHNDTFKAMLDHNKNVNISNLYTIECLDYAIMNYDFSMLFWSHLMKNWHHYHNCLKETIITDDTGNFFKVGQMPFIVYMARTHPIIPTTARKCESSVGIVNFSSMELSYDLENIFTYLGIKMKSDFLKAVSIKDRLGRDDIIKILQFLPKIDISDQSRCMRILTLCYSELMKNDDHSDLEGYSFFLLSQNSEFTKASDLYFMDPSLKESCILNDNFQTILIPLELVHNKSIYPLLRAMKVQIIDKSSLQISFKETIDAQWIMEKLIVKYIYIAALAVKLSQIIIKKDKLQEIVSDYKEKLAQLKFFTGKDLCFTFKNVPVLVPYVCSERSSHGINVYVANDETEEDFPSSLFLEAFSNEIVNRFHIDQLSSLDFIILLAERKQERIENILMKKGLSRDIFNLILKYWQN